MTQDANLANTLCWPSHHPRAFYDLLRATLSQFAWVITLPFDSDIRDAPDLPPFGSEEILHADGALQHARVAVLIDGALVDDIFRGFDDGVEFDGLLAMCVG